MITYPVLRNLTANVILFLVVIALTSCNAVKKVGDKTYLLTENTIYADSVKVKSPEVKNLLTQRPNSSILGYPLRLNLYNIAKDNPDSLYQDWLGRKPKR
ncbi:MAG: hypothetical protein AAF717_16835 [Bacteroidota bacterium]